MRQIWIMAAVVVSMAVGAARMADQAGRNVRAPDPTAAVVAAATTAGLPPTERIYGRDSVMVRPDLHGRFVVDARINGRHLQFLVDTGATMVALRARDAAMLGIHPGPRDFTVQVSTANGLTRAAPTYLGMVEVDNVNVHNVTALVQPDEALGENLLGMSFLSRVHLEYSNGMMVLAQQ